MPEINASLVLQGLLVGGLLGTAKVLWNTVLKLAEIGVRVDDHGRRIDRLEQP